MISRPVQLGNAFRAAIPFLTAFLLLLFSATPGHKTTTSAIIPPLLFMSLYYWSIHRPDLMPTWLVLLLGLAEDSLTDSIFGLHALLFLIAHHMLISQRRFFVSGSFLMLWWGFALTVLMLLAAGWFLSSLLSWTFLPLAPAIGQTFFAIACFPPVAWAFIKIHRAFLH